MQSPPRAPSARHSGTHDARSLSPARRPGSSTVASPPRRAAANTGSKSPRRPQRREAIRLTHAPVKLTTSQFDLFAASTGNTIRTGDAYARFLVGPRKVRVDVPTLLELEEEVRIQAASANPKGRGRVPGAATLTVGKGTKGFSKKSLKIPPAKKKYRLLRKEQFKTDVFEKWDRLEDIRIQYASSTARVVASAWIHISDSPVFGMNQKQDHCSHAVAEALSF